MKIVKFKLTLTTCILVYIDFCIVAAETHFNASSDKGLAEGVLLGRKILTTVIASPDYLTNTNVTDHSQTRTNRRDQSKTKTDQTGKENHKQNDLPYIF